MSQPIPGYVSQPELLGVPFSIIWRLFGKTQVCEHCGIGFYWPLLFNPGRKKEILVLIPIKYRVFFKGLVYREQHRDYSLIQPRVSVGDLWLVTWVF